MGDYGLLQLFVLPAGLGLLGFIEPCSIASSMLFVEYLEGRAASERIRQVVLFAGTRAMFIGLLGVVAVTAGGSFVAYQKGAWVVLGALYVLLGLALATGAARMLRVAIGPRLRTLGGSRGSAILGVLFGFNIPACAAPLLAALLAGAAATGASGATMASGFTALAVFGLFLSVPLVLAVLSARARRLLDVLAHHARRLPVWTGLVFIALGAWSIRFGLFVPMPTV